MAAGLEASVSDAALQKLTGWINVPADCVRKLKSIHLHAARPAGVNEPTNEGVAGTQKIVELVDSLDEKDLCIVLLSGGGSALLPAPIPPLTLADKQAVTRFLMNSGATIQELNAVRKRLSQIKGGGLARASRAGTTIALVISDIVGDPLDMIASGPTYPDPTTDADALAVLRKFDARPPHVPQSVFELLSKRASHGETPAEVPHNIANHVIGNNAMAVHAAAERAEMLGYQVISLGSENCGLADEEGRKLAERCRSLREGDPGSSLPACILSGGEPTVTLAETEKPRKGGRNQELVLAAVDALKEDGMRGIVILSGGTDGEDGPTDAAGAVADEAILSAALEKKMDPQPFLAINNSYNFFGPLDALLKTGPTHTNVMDLRVALVGAS